jgi:iron complex outermembrane recepter protein
MKQQLFAVTPLLICVSMASQASDMALDITGTNVFQLMNLKITSLSKKQQSLNKAPAAVYVLSHDEIERLGVSRIADALRYVPGVEVARIDASRWAISMRGFNGRAANKLLVMIDGRSVYSPLFSGVLWEEKDILLADVERIEVIRGPGGAIWGANAVNGVINIITKTAKETQGTLVDVSTGLKQRQVTQIRHGWKLNDDAYLRVYGKHRQRQETNNEYNNDDNQQNQFGFRLDYNLSTDNLLTLQGDIYSGNVGELDGQLKPAGQEHSGGNFLANWQVTDSKQGKHTVTGYYDNTHLKVPGLEDDRELLNLDYQFEQQWQQHAFVTGFGIRFLSDDVYTAPLEYIQPRYRDDQVVNAFFQDDIAFLEDELHLIWGTKYEHNDYSGDEWQPSVRFSYQLAQSLLWGAWSKAVRVPTRWETDIRFGAFSGERLKPENANVYELGWRKQWADTGSLDITVYQSDYDDLLSIEANGYGNQISGTVKGIELSSSIQVQQDWSLRLNLSHAAMALTAQQGSLSVARAQNTEGQMPQNMAQIISMWDINSQWNFNAALRYVDELKSNKVDAYWSVDASVNWQASQQFSVKLVARNLGDGPHQEWDPYVPVEADVVINLRWEL